MHSNTPPMTVLSPALTLGPAVADDDASLLGRVVGEFQSAIDDPVLLLRWPVEFKIRVSYEVVGNALVSELVVDNPASMPLTLA